MSAFEKWVQSYSNLPISRDAEAYTDIRVEMMWHAWQAARNGLPNWPNHATAIHDPLFQQVRGIVGTENFGQEDALRQAVMHVLAAG